VRTLVGRVFAKTGCRRQAELVRLVGALNDARAAAAGVSAGLATAAPLLAAAAQRETVRRLRALLELPLSAPPDQHATIVSRGFAPGDDTGYHVHGCGHEIVCVMDGALTMEYPSQAPIETVAGEAIYVAPGVVHRGVNTSASCALSLLHVGIGPGGSIDRRDL
jgi:quercetin dioxygenase-like cupin family protein